MGLIALAVVVGRAGLGCSNGLLVDGAGVGGAGGSGVGGTGVGGTSAGGTGVGGTGVGGNSGGSGLQVPGCLVDLLASCAPQGTCTSGATDANMVSPVCFASGVRAALSHGQSADSCGGTTQVVDVTKADGSPCYSFEWYGALSQGCEGFRYTWKDASGAIVATGTQNYYAVPTLSITCAANGEAQSCTDRPVTGPSDPCCAVGDFGAAGCTRPASAGVECPRGACEATN
jgi:hypothetical protein